MAHELRGASAIVGVGVAGLGEAPGWTAWEIMARAAKAALDDAGVRLDEVDGLFCAMMEDSMPALLAAEHLGVRPRFIDGTMVGGSSFVNFLASATAALHAGLCDVALVCYGSNQRTASGRLVTASKPPPFEAPYRPRYPHIRLRDGRRPAHARVRHHARAARRRRRRRPRLGRAQPRGVHARSAGRARTCSPRGWWAIR